MDISVNLVQFLRDEFPTEVFYWDLIDNTALETTPPDDCTKIMSSGGSSAPWLKYTQATIQILTRKLNKPAAAQLAKDIFDKLHGRFGLILPAALNVNGRNYPEVQTAEIRAGALPYPIGQDDAGRTSYTTNYLIIYRED